MPDRRGEKLIGFRSASHSSGATAGLTFQSFSLFGFIVHSRVSINGQVGHGRRQTGVSVGGVVTGVATPLLFRPPPRPPPVLQRLHLAPMVIDRLHQTHDTGCSQCGAGQEEESCNDIACGM